MAKEKKSFVLYCDLIHTIKKLNNEDAGELFKHILSYVNDENPTTENTMVDIVFEPIKQQLKRDLKKFEKTKEDRSYNGRLGNLKKYNLDLFNKVIDKKIKLLEAEKIAKGRKASHSDSVASQGVANVAVNDNVNVNDNDNVNVNEIIDKSITIINNKVFLENCKKSIQWLETTAMQKQVKLETIILYLEKFDYHLIEHQEQKETLKDYKSHFVYWLNKQNLSNYRKKVIGKTNQV